MIRFFSVLLMVVQISGAAAAQAMSLEEAKQALLSPEERANAPESGAMVRGYGNQSCGKWTADRKGNSWHQGVAWVNGYLTAYEYHGELGSKTWGKAYGEAGWAWIDNYCQENPLSNVHTATMKLILALIDL